MIAELTKSYRGVICRQCGEPIPVPAKVSALQDEFDGGNPEKELSHSFLARCRACDSESRHEVGEIQKFEGEPRKRTLRARTAKASGSI